MADVDDVKKRNNGRLRNKNASWPPSCLLSALAEVDLSSSKVQGHSHQILAYGRKGCWSLGWSVRPNSRAWWHYEGDDNWPLVGKWPLAWQSVNRQRMAAGCHTTSWRRMSSQPMCCWWWCAQTYAWLMM
jgi:hypothetical protein